MVTPFLVAGLGNPGAKYANTRHNIGFMVVDALAKRWGVDRFSEKFQGLLGEAQIAGRKVLLLKPQTYMNLSGQSVGAAVHFYKIEADTSCLLVSDDVDIPPAALRIRKEGGPGGHNGLKSVIECLGGEKFPRLRIGIGRSTHAETHAHVLGQIAKSEATLYQEAVDRACDAVETMLRDGIEKAMNLFNQKKEGPKP